MLAKGVSQQTEAFELITYDQCGLYCIVFSLHSHGLCEKHRIYLDCIEIVMVAAFEIYGRGQKI